MSIDAALGATIGLIPITVGAGIAMSFAERAFPRQRQRQAPRRQRRQTSRRKFSLGTGDFSNVGY